MAEMGKKGRILGLSPQPVTQLALFQYSTWITSYSTDCAIEIMSDAHRFGTNHQKLGKMGLRRAENRDRGSFWTVQLRDSGTS